ncbi:MAG: hypothetical protein AB2693_31855, partial [Candidatus Thiodiazotropha sp.]
EGTMTVVAMIQDRRPNAEIMVSLGVPRNNDTLNRKIEKINIILKERVGDKNNTKVIDNSNLFYRGGPARGMLNEDGIHLSREGTFTLGRNMKGAIKKVMTRSENSQNRDDFNQYKPASNGYWRRRQHSSGGFNRGQGYRGNGSQRWGFRGSRGGQRY